MVEAAADTPQIEWIGHAGFRIKFSHEGISRTVYIDPWLGCPTLPDSCKNDNGEVVTPDDADLILVTHGHFDHSSSAVEIAQASKKENGCQIGAIFEIGQVYTKMKGFDETKILGCNKSGTVDLGWCKFTMVSADHSSSCGFHEGNIVDGGAPAGFVLRLDNGVSIYHAGDTGVFSDMEIIDDLY
jgi:L-ascorbate metabolism protein UlaG (beta-lactamase superfamily)